MKQHIQNEIGIITCQTEAQFNFVIELLNSILDSDEFNYNDFAMDSEIAINNFINTEITAFEFISMYLTNFGETSNINVINTTSEVSLKYSLVK